MHQNVNVMYIRIVLLMAAAAIVAQVKAAAGQQSFEREKYNFNYGWMFQFGDDPQGSQVGCDDKGWRKVSLPHTYNEDEAFKVKIWYMTDTVAWYRKHFSLPAKAKGKKVFIEFEGARQCADVYLNGKEVGYSENGVMAFGFDLTPYINYGGDNVIAVRVDNDWKYKERSSGEQFQWNDINFNANYGGLPRNVWMHITDNVYQTLPLYSNLKTTGVYVYAKNIDIRNRSAILHAESEVKNETSKNIKLKYKVSVYDDNKSICSFEGKETMLNPGSTAVLSAEGNISGINFWSWGYGKLYKIKTQLVRDGKVSDEVNTVTGFRKTRFGNGMVWLNDRVIQLKGYAQRSSNEWPGVGCAYPAWLSDYSNDMLLEANGNLYRWMHVTPSKQDIESCDRCGVIQMMPAGDAEKDIQGRRWQQRVELMRDAIIYNRNNPSILFYESGNNQISEEHMAEMKALKEKYDPYGGRAIGCRNMLASKEAEYGGEMLYINKSAGKPMVQTEYCRDEAYRKYWDEQSYPYHVEGYGPPVEALAGGKKVVKPMPAEAYNRNQDEFTKELVRRWYDMWLERPGTGKRVNSGGAKIVFSDTQTYGRSELNYRVSGVVDAMRIPKDGYYAHKVMWNGWVDTEQDDVYIIGHWNYAPGVKKNVYVVSTTPEVELLLNGKLLGKGKRTEHFLFTFDSVKWEKGTLEAVAYNSDGKTRTEVARYALQTAGKADHLRMTLIERPGGMVADGNDVALVEFEVVDAQGHRCPLANDTITFELHGPAEWRGGIAQGTDNFVLAKALPVEAGVNRVMVRSTIEPGAISLTASSKNYKDVKVEWKSKKTDTNTLSSFNPSEALEGYTKRGATPSTPSYTDKNITIDIANIKSGTNHQDTQLSCDDNEGSEWKSDKGSDAYITYTLVRKALIDDICLKLAGWRQLSYPIEILAGDKVIWKGITPKSLGYIHIYIDNPVLSDNITIRLSGTAEGNDAFGAIVEVEAAKAGELDFVGKQSTDLRIIEAEFRERIIKEI